MAYTVKNWQPQIELTRLLAALAEEIVAATPEDLHLASVLADRPVAAAAKEVRELIAAASGDQDEPDLGLPLAEAARRREHCARQH